MLKDSKENFKKWYYLLTLGRMIDERAPSYLKQSLGWSYHAPYAGHDGIQLAIGQVFDKSQDHLFPYYRDMLTCLSAGFTAEELILNGLSKATDIASGGRHMSNHFAKPAWNIHNVSSCTGNHIQHAVGLARAMKTYGKKGVVFNSQGESSFSEGYCYEAINGATREKLPVIFISQDNGYGISVPKFEQTANEKMSDNFRGFKNLEIIQCDGTDVMDSMKAMRTAKDIVVKKNIPVLVEANCVRIGPHSNSDKHELYRDQNELDEAKAKDPYKKFKEIILKKNILKESILKSLEQDARKQLLEAHAKALKAPNPTPESIHQFVIPQPYVPKKFHEGVHNEQGESIKYIEALNQTLKEEFRKNPDTYLWGQDVANKDKGGIFNVSKGMQKEFGKKRIFNAPIAEDFIVGTANGFSRLDKKIRVVVEGAEFADYFWPAMEQLVECSHDFWRSYGQFSPNIVIRIASGGYIGGGIYHSQNIEASICTLPGLRVVAPSFADDASGLLRVAIRSQGPTVFLEPKSLYNAKSAMTVVPKDFEVPFGKARVRCFGENLSIFTYGNTTHMCLQVAEKLSKEGFSIEVIDLRSLNPLDEETIIKSISKTNRALVVHEDKVFAGFGGEIVAFINEKAFHFLDAPVVRLGATYTPVGFNRVLEQAILPSVNKIEAAVRKILSY